MRKKMIVFLSVFVSIFFLTAGSLFAASITIYTDNTSFTAVAGTVDVETFDDSILNSGLSVALSSAGDISGGQLYDDLLRGSRSTTFDFSSAVTAFAGDIFDLSPGGVGNGIEVTVYFSGGGSQVLSTIITANGFFGFVSDTAIASILLQDYSGLRERYYLTSAVYSSQVPEPTTMLLLGFGLIGLAGIKRRFKK